MASSGLLYGLVVACEAGFWLVLLLALVARYQWHAQRLSRALLQSLPALDLLLLAFTAADLRAGTPATFAHGLATAYVGFTVAFGSLAVRWADRRFVHWMAGRWAPDEPPLLGWHAVRDELALWLRSIGAWLITLVLLTALIAWIDDDVATAPLRDWFRFAFGSVVLWFVFGPVWSVVFFRRQRPSAEG